MRFLAGPAASDPARLAGATGLASVSSVKSIGDVFLEVSFALPSAGFGAKARLSAAPFAIATSAKDLETRKPWAGSMICLAGLRLGVLEGPLEGPAGLGDSFVCLDSFAVLGFLMVKPPARSASSPMIEVGRLAPAISSWKAFFVVDVVSTVSFGSGFGSGLESGFGPRCDGC